MPDTSCKVIFTLHCLGVSDWLVLKLPIFSFANGDFLFDQPSVDKQSTNII